MSNIQQKSRERVQVLHSEEAEKQVFSPVLYPINIKDPTPVKTRPEKRFKYLNIDTLSPQHVDNGCEYIEVADDLGLPADTYPDLAKELAKLGIATDDVIPSIRDITVRAE